MKRYYVLSFLLSFLLSFNPGAQGAIGINYGLQGKNLPSPKWSISKLHEMNITKIRIFRPHRNVLKALHNSGISVIVGANHEDLASLSAARKWVKTHILPHQSYVNFTCIVVRNQVLSENLPKALENLHSAVIEANLSIPVSTAISMRLISTPYPPSASVFSRQSQDLMTNITRFLSSNKFPLLVNVHPYSARKKAPQPVNLAFSLFKDDHTVISDGPYTYRNLFDTMVDAVRVAMQKVAGSTVKIIVSETGWPTEGGPDASVKNAKMYVNHVIKHVLSGQGTPRMPGKEIEAYIFSMFNEDLKPKAIQRNWGLFYPNLTEVYHIRMRKKKEDVRFEPVSEAIGINYGLLGDNLPTPSKTISQLQQIKVGNIRIFQPDEDVLKALHNSGISVIIGSYNDDLRSLASNSSAAEAWIKSNILPHQLSVKIKCIALGNEVYPGELAQFIPDAMKNIKAALVAANLSIPVSTSVSMHALSTSYPPSTGEFSDQAKAVMTLITGFLQTNKYPLLVNVYPYFARAGDPGNLTLDYALLKDNGPPVKDGPNTYFNLFDAMTDAVYAALEKINASDVEIIVSETGWPTAGGSDASIENAQTYVNNLIAHVSSGKGTPRRPRKQIQTYIFAMFNENRKTPGVEQNWGLYYPNLTEVYHVNTSKIKEDHPSGPVSGPVGINYGLLGNNRPSPSKTISLLHQIKVGNIRIFQPDHDVLTALHNSNVSVIVGSINDDLRSLASNSSAAASWINTNILPHQSSVNITCISLGNQVYPGELTQYIPAAMKNVNAALVAANLSIPVSTTVSMEVLSNYDPPSKGEFDDHAKPIMTQITQFLESNKYPLLVNVHPYFARVEDSIQVKLDYALLKGNGPVVINGSKSYFNLFDAMIDGVYAALEKVNASNVEIIVSETGWPTGGGIDASIENANIYMNNLIAHVSSGKGTPRRPGKQMKTSVFSMFNENRRAPGVDQNWGLYYSNLTEVYHVNHFLVV